MNQIRLRTLAMVMNVDAGAIENVCAALALLTTPDPYCDDWLIAEADLPEIGIWLQLRLHSPVPGWEDRAENHFVRTDEADDHDDDDFAEIAASIDRADACATGIRADAAADAMGIDASQLVEAARSKGGIVDDDDSPDPLIDLDRLQFLSIGLSDSGVAIDPAWRANLGLAKA